MTITLLRLSPPSVTCISSTGATGRAVNEKPQESNPEQVVTQYNRGDEDRVGRKKDA